MSDEIDRLRKRAHFDMYVLVFFGALLMIVGIVLFLAGVFIDDTLKIVSYYRG